MTYIPMAFSSFLDDFFGTPHFKKRDYEELSFFLPGKEKDDVELVVLPEESLLKINDKKGNLLKSLWLQGGIPEIDRVDMKGGVLTVKFRKKEPRKTSSKIIPINSR